MIEIAQRDHVSTLGVWDTLIIHTWHSQAESLKNFIAMTMVPYFKAVLYVYTRLPFGVSSAPGIFQRTLSLLQDVPMTSVYLDDILISGATEEEHNRNLQTVLHKIKSNGLRLKRNKCSFLQTSVSYLGHIIDGEGINSPC